MIKHQTILMLLLSTFPYLAIGQTTQNEAVNADTRPERMTMKGRHGLFENLGILSQANTSILLTSAHFIYSYWIEEDWALQISVGLLSAEGSVPFGGSDVMASIVPISLGAKYYPVVLFSRGDVRPYVTAALTSYVGYASEFQRFATIRSSKMRSSMAFGAHGGAGIEWYPVQKLSLGLSGGFDLMSNFKQAIGSDNNFSGVRYSVSLGYTFGKTLPD